MFLTSLAAAQLTSNYAADHSFFLLPTRMWELLAGALLVTTPVSPAMAHPSWKQTSLAWAGLFMVFASFFLFSEHSLHPSLLTLIPVCGTALVIRFVISSPLLLAVLSARPVVAVGLLSYGLYIWHFPIFAFGWLIDPHAAVADKLIWLLILVAVTVTTYWLIEKPARNAHRVPLKALLAMLAAGLAVCLMFAFGGLRDGYKPRFPDLVNVPAEPTRLENHAWLTQGDAHDKRIVLVGDSHMGAIALTLKSWAQDNRYHYAQSIVGGCQLIAGLNRVYKQTHTLTKCTAQRQEQRLAFLNNAAPSIVILGGRLPLLLQEQNFDNSQGGVMPPMETYLQTRQNDLTTQPARQQAIAVAYQKTIDRLYTAGHSVVLVYPIPEAGWHIPEKIKQKIADLDGNVLRIRELLEHAPITTGYEVFKARSGIAYALLDQLVPASMIRVYPEQVFCNRHNAGVCATHDADQVYYRDEHHLTDAGARRLIEPLAQAIAKSVKAGRQNKKLRDSSNPVQHQARVLRHTR